MERLDGVLLLTALLLAGLKSAEAQNIPSYFRRGGTLVLRPVSVPVPGPISTLVWKHNGDLVGEWFGSSDPDYYRSFKGRTAMNTVTGELEISSVTAADNGVYSVGINNQDQKDVYQAEELQDVPQPDVLVRRSLRKIWSSKRRTAVLRTSPAEWRTRPATKKVNPNPTRSTIRQSSGPTNEGRESIDSQLGNRGN